MSRPRGVSKFKKSAPSIRALWKRAGPSTLKRCNQFGDATPSFYFAEKMEYVL